ERSNKKYLERFLIRPVTARVRRNEDEQTQSLSPSQVLKDKIHTPSDRRKLEARLAWVEDDYGEKKTHIFLKACRTCGQRVAKVVVNPAQANYSADFSKRSENIQKYMAFRHQTPSNTPSPTVNDN